MRRALIAAAGIMLVIGLAVAVSIAGDEERPVARTAPATTGTTGTTGTTASRSSAPSTAGPQAESTTPIVDLGGRDPGDLRRDLDGLAEDWAAGGGDQGYAYWERTWRQWQAGQVAGSTFKQYVVSYLQLLDVGRERVESRDLDVDAAEPVRRRLLDAIDERRAALELLTEVLDGPLEGRTTIDGEDLAAAQQRATAQIDASFRDTRRAMDESQRLLDAVSERRLHEDAFL